MSSRILKVVQLILGLVILGFLVFHVGLVEVYEVLFQIRVEYILLAFIFLVIVHFLAGVNIKLLAGALGYTTSLYELTISCVYSWVVGLLIPLRVSSLSLIVLLKKSNIQTKDSIAITFVDKLLTFIVLFVFVAVGLLYYFPQYAVVKYIFFFLVFIVAFAVATFSIYAESKLVLVGRWFGIKDLEGFASAAKKIVLKKKAIIANTLVTVLRLCIIALIPYTLFLNFNVAVNFSEFVLISAIITAISSLPLTTAGLGVREFSAVGLYTTLMHIDPVIITSTYLAFMIIKYVAALGFLLLRRG